MSNHVSTPHRLSAVGFLLVLTPMLFTLGACTPQIALVPSRAADADFHTITVIGRGEASAKPDIAHAQLGVEVTAATVGDATRLAAVRMTDIMNALRSSGVADKDVRTSNFSVNREQPNPGYPMPMSMPTAEMLPAPAAPPPPPNKATPKGTAATSPATAPSLAIGPSPITIPRGEFYRVSNTVDVTIRDLNKVGQVIDAALAAGANNVWGVSFSLDKTNTLEAQAREKASADAKTRAEALAKQQGVSADGVVSISEVFDGGGPYPQPMPMGMSMAKDALGTPMSPGEITFAAQIRVVYALKGGAPSP